MSLSDRVRPDVEAALWVVEEIKELERAHNEQEEELDATMMAFNILKKENARLREALKAIAVAEGRENYPQELWAALLMDKARGVLEQK